MPPADVPIIHYIDTRFADMWQAMETTAKTLDTRLQSMNEIRAQLEAQAATFITRDTVEGMRATNAVKIEALQKFQANIEGRILMINAGSVVLNLLIMGGALFLGMR